MPNTTAAKNGLISGDSFGASGALVTQIHNMRNGSQAQMNPMGIQNMPTDQRLAYATIKAAAIRDSKLSQAEKIAAISSLIQVAVPKSNFTKALESSGVTGGLQLYGMGSVLQKISGGKKTVSVPVTLATGWTVGKSLLSGFGKLAGPLGAAVSLAGALFGRDKHDDEMDEEIRRRRNELEQQGLEIKNMLNKAGINPSQYDLARISLDKQLDQSKKAYNLNTGLINSNIDEIRRGTAITLRDIDEKTQEAIAEQKLAYSTSGAAAGGGNWISEHHAAVVGQRAKDEERHKEETAIAGQEYQRKMQEISMEEAAREHGLGKSRINISRAMLAEDVRFMKEKLGHIKKEYERESTQARYPMLNALSGLLESAGSHSQRKAIPGQIISSALG